jgi:hypothetical protein
MAFLLDVTFQDVNQLESKSSMWIDSEADSVAVLAALKAASNAKILRATLSTPVPLVTITNNDATAANVETATSKAIISMRGADAASSGEPFAHVRVGIPAPIGSLINGLSGDVTNAEVQSLKTKVLSKSGVQMDVVESIKYNRH